MPNTTGLGLKKIGVALNDDKGIRINDRLETSVEGIFAIGDATFEFGRYPIRLEAGGVEGKVWKYEGKAIKESVVETAPTELDVSAYLSALMIYDAAPAIDLFQKDLTDGQMAQEIVSKGLIPAMTLVSARNTPSVVTPIFVQTSRFPSEKSGSVILYLF